MLGQDRIKYFFTLTKELPNVEFKGPGNKGDNPLLGKVVCAAIAMANQRDSSVIIIGMTKTNTGLAFDGFTPDQIKTWKYKVCIA